MLSRVVTGRGSSCFRRSTDLARANHVVASGKPSHVRRYILAGTTVDSAKPPCATQVFDRVEHKGELPGGRFQWDNPTYSAPPGGPQTPKVTLNIPDKQAKDEGVEDEFWRGLAPYKDVSVNDFLSWRWSIKVCQTL